MDLDPCLSPDVVGMDPREESKPVIPHPVRDPMCPDRVHSRVSEEDLESIPGSRISFQSVIDIFKDAREHRDLPHLL
jgi:hypothetical protein